MDNIRRTLNLFLIGIIIALAFCRAPAPGKIRITTTTTSLACIVTAITMDRVEVNTIVPAGMCPGHFDISADDVKQLNSSVVLLNHGWEEWTDKLLAAVDHKPSLHTIATRGNIMVPDFHKQAAEQVVALLCSLDRDSRNYYMNNYSAYLRSIDSVVAKIKMDGERLKGKKVICSELQAEFLEWLGLDIVFTYRRSEELTPRVLADAIKTMNDEHVDLVVDNLQSGPDTGLTLAQETNTGHVILTNFPIDSRYPETLMKNFETVARALQ
jgi:zinc transport system substrate-binding protein